VTLIPNWLCWGLGGETERKDSVAFQELRHPVCRAQHHSASSVALRRGTTCMGMGERIKPRRRKMLLEGFLKKVAPEK